MSSVPQISRASRSSTVQRPVAVLIGALFVYFSTSGCSVSPYTAYGAQNVQGGASRKPPVQRAARPSSPKLKKLNNGHYKVTGPWRLELNGKVWNIQKGYTSNGITAPDYIKRTLGDGIDQPETWSAVYHDWLFTQPGVSRQEADKHFRELLIAYGVSAQKANMMYSVVARYSANKEGR